MRNDDKTGVAERLFQEGVDYFIRHVDKWVSRKELQDALKIGKTQAWKLCNVLSTRLYLIQEEQKHENSQLKLKLDSEHLKSAAKELATVSTLTDNDRWILTILMNMAESSGLYGDMVKNLKNHLYLSRFSEKGIIPIVNYSPEMQTGTEGSRFIPSVLEAIDHSKSIRITYKRPWSDEEKTYSVNPVGIFSQNGSLYLLSYNPFFNDNVVHAFSRIRNVEIHDEASTPDEFKDLSRIIDPFGIAIDEKPMTVTVWVDHWQAPFEIEAARTRNATISKHEDGSITMTIQTRNRFACKRWLMSLGSQAKCLSPFDLAEEIQKEHSSASALY